MALTKIDKMEQTLATIKEQLDDLYEGQQAIKDMIRELAVVTDIENDGFDYETSFDDIEGEE